MRLLTFLLIFPLLIGCAQTAEVACWEPAQIDATGINRISVMDFSGVKGSEVSMALSARLWDNDFYTLVDHSEFVSPIQPANYAEENDLQSALSAAQAANVDALILGSVIEYRCEDQILESTDLDIISFAEGHGKQAQSENGLSLELRNTIYREGSVTLAYRLVATDTGEILASKQISKHFRGEMRQGENSLPEKGRVLEMLLSNCLDEVVQMLAPHQTSCELQLASCDFWTKGSGQVKEGLKQVAKGDWDAAEAAWRDAVYENHENHAALHNLSIAAARRQQYDQAEKLILDALKCEHKKCYTATLETIRERRTALAKTVDQREARQASFEDSIWQ